MNLPRILLDNLPNLTDAVGLVGSFVEQPANDDRIVYLMVFLYETYPPEAML